MLKLVSMMWAIYYLAFFRRDFGLSIADGALVAVGAIVIGTSGRIIGGYLVNRIGRKRLPVITLVVQGLSIPLIAFVPELWIAIVVLYFTNFIGAFADPALINLILEQVPESRGTMMSINNVFTFLGVTIGAGIGGFVLALFNYTGIFIVFPLLILITAAFFFFTKDPCKTKETDSLETTLS